MRGSANSAALRLIIVAGELKSEVTRRKTQSCKKRTETFWQTSRLSPASLSLRTVGEPRPSAVARGRRQWAGPGLSYRLGWLARQAIVSGGRGPVGPRARAHAKTRSREVSMREGQFLRSPLISASAGDARAREHAGGNAAVSPAPVVPLSQVAGDTVGLIRGTWD